MNKLRALKALGRKRKLDRCKGYKSVGDYHRGKYECDFVSPFTKSAKNADSPIMVLLQDWSSDEALRRPFSSDVAEIHERPLHIRFRFKRAVQIQCANDMLQMWPSIHLPPLTHSPPQQLERFQLRVSWRKRPKRQH